MRLHLGNLLEGRPILPGRRELCHASMQKPDSYIRAHSKNKVHPTEAYLTGDAVRNAASPQDFSGISPVSNGKEKLRPLTASAVRGLTRHWRTGARIGHRAKHGRAGLRPPGTVRSMVGPAPFLQAVSVFLLTSRSATESKESALSGHCNHTCRVSRYGYTNIR